MKVLVGAAAAMWLAGWCSAQQAAEEPLYWDFFRRQESQELPALEYDEAVPSYRKVLDPETDKLDESPAVVGSTQVAVREVGFLAGAGSRSFARFRQPAASGVTTGGWESISSPLSEGAAEQRLSLSLGHTAMPGLAILDAAAGFAANRIGSWLTQTDLQLGVAQYAAPGLRLSYRPAIRFVHARDSGFQKLFMEQEFRAAYVASRAMGASLAVVPVSLDGCAGIGYGIDAAVRDLPWNGAGCALGVMFRDIEGRPRTSGVYHSVTVSQRLRWTTVSLADERMYDTGYLADYFLRWPDLMLHRIRHYDDDGHTTAIPDVRRSAVSVAYERDPSFVRISAERLDYSAYPQYEWSGGLIPVLAGPRAFARIAGSMRASMGGVVVQAAGWGIADGPAPPCMPGYRLECGVSVQPGRWSAECAVVHEGGIRLPLSPDHDPASPGPAAELADPRTVLRSGIGYAVARGIALQVRGFLPLAGRAFASPDRAREPEVSCGVQLGW